MAKTFTTDLTKQFLQHKILVNKICIKFAKITEQVQIINISPTYTHS